MSERKGREKKMKRGIETDREGGTEREREVTRAEFERVGL
jgi:hypothetical protein